MRILILGQNYSAKRFCEMFEKNKDNIVFSNSKENKNCFDFQTNEDIVEFSVENVINLVLIIDENYIDSNLSELIAQKNITVFCPSKDAVQICKHKSTAKRFAHKNKIPTPRFQIIEKPQTGLDYIKQTGLPVAIKPDNHNFFECTKFAQTHAQAQKIINELFASGNKKIVIEDYIEGKNFSVWVLSDGYSTKILGKTAKYQNNIACFEPSFLTKDLVNSVYNSTIAPTIDALAANENEYIGILGFDFILDKNNTPYLVGYNSFFDDINVDFFIDNFNLNWFSIFESTVIGDVFIKYEFKTSDKIKVTIRQENDEIEFISASTKTNLDCLLKNLEIDTKEYKEALKVWKS